MKTRSHPAFKRRQRFHGRFVEREQHRAEKRNPNCARQNNFRSERDVRLEVPKALPQIVQDNETDGAQVTQNRDNDIQRNIVAVRIRNVVEQSDSSGAKRADVLNIAGKTGLEPGCGRKFGFIPTVPRILTRSLRQRMSGKKTGLETLLQLERFGNRFGWGKNPRRPAGREWPQFPATIESAPEIRRSLQRL